MSSNDSSLQRREMGRKLRLARELANVAFDVASLKFGKAMLLEVEHGWHPLTTRELEILAQIYERPTSWFYENQL